MKKLSKYISVLFCVCFILSCNLQPPKSVSIKTNAKYNFSLGEISQDLSEEFSMDEILEQEEDSPFKIYEYKPEGESQKAKKMLMEIPIQEIPLDFSSYFEKTDISESLSQMSFSQKISVPDFETQQLSHKIDISAINDAINDSVRIAGPNNPDLDLSFDLLNEQGFESITYSSGDILIQDCEFDLGEYGTVFDGELTGEIRLLHNGNIVSKATFENGTARLPLTNVTLYSQGMSIEFSEGVGNIGWFGVINGQVKNAKGISLQPTVVEFDEELELNFSQANFDSFVIGEGNLGIEITLPEQWEGIYINYDVELSGAINASTEESLFKKNIPLNNTELYKQNLGVKSQPVVYIQNADIYFDEQPELKASLQIDKIETVSISVEEDISTSFNHSEALPEEATNVIKQICFTKSGFNLLYKNTLPEGNDISIITKSNFLKLDSTETLYSNKEDENLPILCTEKNVQDISEGTEIDFSAQVLLPGCTSPDEKTITVKNVVPGQEYEFAMTIKPIIEWDFVKIDTSSFSQKNTIPTEVNLDSFTTMLDEMLGSDLSGKLILPELNTYLFMSKPENEIFDKIQFNGEISAFQGKQVGETYEPIDEDSKVYLLDKDTSLKFVPTPVLQKENNVVYTDVQNLEASLGPIDLSSILTTAENAEEGTSLCIDYDLSFSDENASEEEITLYKKDLEGATSTSIEILAMVVLPLTLKATDDIEIDFSSLINSNKDSEGEEDLENPEEPKDLLGRTEPSEINDTTQILVDLVKSCSLNYYDTQLPIVCDNLKLIIDFNPEDDKAPNELKLSGGTLKIEPEDILEVYPLIPQIKIKIPKNESLSVAEELILKAKLNLCIETDGEISIWGGNKQ